MKIAMLQVPEAIKSAGLEVKILLQVHDELVLECPEQILIETSHLVQKVMESAYKLAVPLSTDARFGNNWGDLKSFD